MVPFPFADVSVPTLNPTLLKPVIAVVTPVLEPNA